MDVLASRQSIWNSTYLRVGDVLKVGKLAADHLPYLSSHLKWSNCAFPFLRPEFWPYTTFKRSLISKPDAPFSSQFRPASHHYGISKKLNSQKLPNFPLTIVQESRCSCCLMDLSIFCDWTYNLNKYIRQSSLNSCLTHGTWVMWRKKGSFDLNCCKWSKTILNCSSNTGWASGSVNLQVEKLNLIFVEKIKYQNILVEPIQESFRKLVRNLKHFSNVYLSWSLKLKMKIRHLHSKKLR